MGEYGEKCKEKAKVGKEEYFEEMLEELRKHGIISTNELKKDLVKLVTSNKRKFKQIFYHDMLRSNTEEIEQFNRFELLNRLSRKQRKKLKGIKLWRWEYRENSNFKCIFAVTTVNNSNISILLCAFNEDWDKKKGNDNYEENINRAISILSQWLS